jgi:hypothetical protein
MEIVPRVEMKSFDKCEPGELIRAPLFGGLCLGLVATRGEERLIIALRGDHIRETLPRYTPLNGSEFDAALSYGKNYTVEVDLDGPVGIGSKDNIWEQSGTLALDGSSWLLRADPFRGVVPPRPKYYKLADGAMMGTNEFSNAAAIAVLGKWKICPKQLPETALPLLPLFEFGDEQPNKG